jgi:ATP synthase protein I
MRQNLPINVARAGAKRLLLLQFLVAIVAALLFWVFVSFYSAYSALIGGLVCVLANWIFAKKVFVHSGARKAKQILQGIYLGEVLKYVLSIMLFIISVKFLYIKGLPFFVNYIITQSAFWVSPWMFNSK